MRLVAIVVVLLALAPSAHAQGGDFADGLMGGPDYWDVAGVPAGETLNVRAGAGAHQPVLGELGNDDTVRNLGCKMVGAERWCQIEAGAEQKTVGWVNGRYLVESSNPPQDGGVANVPESGEVPCATVAGQPTGRCPFRAVRGLGGNASVWIALPAGGERYVEFVAGEPVNTDPGLTMTFEKSADLFLIRIGAERYEIPDAVVFGG